MAAMNTVDPNNPTPPANTGAGFVEAIKQAFVPDLETLIQNLEDAKKELQTAQAQEAKARQRYERSIDDLTPLKRQLLCVQDKLRQAESEVKQAEQSYRNAETQNRNQRAAVVKCRDDIAELDRKIKSKRVEIDKLQAELKTFSVQTKKQTDMLAEIKEAWEKAEAEATEFEAKMQKNK